MNKSKETLIFEKIGNCATFNPNSGDINAISDLMETYATQQKVEMLEGWIEDETKKFGDLPTTIRKYLTEKLKQEQNGK